MNTAQKQGPFPVRSFIVGTAALWSVILLSWAGHVLRAGASVAFLMAVAAVAVAVTTVSARSARGGDRVRAVRAAVALALLVGVPVVFDPRTLDTFNLVKYTAAVVGACVLVAFWVVEAVRQRRAPAWRNGLQWPLLALLAWTALSTATSVSPRVSLLGAYGSYNGLYATIAFAVLVFAAVEAFTIDQVRVALSALYFGAGGLCILYGFVQLHDRVWPGHPWDWVQWGQSPTFSKTTAIWSTFGNPNHFAGFLAVILPIGVVLYLLYRDWRARALIVVISGGCLLQIFKTGGRGAWVGASVALLALGLLLVPEVKRLRRAWRLLIVAGVVAVLATGLVLVSSGSLRHQVSGTVDFNTDTFSQRIQFWKAAVRMGNDRPLVGAGPDTYSILYPTYQGHALAQRYGPDNGVNGPHNVFMNYLATLGYPGLGAFLALLVVVTLRAVGAWRRLRCLESCSEASGGDKARRERLCLTAAAAGLVAYLVQASFDVEQIGLSFSFWALLGLVGTIALHSGVPDTLRPRRLIARPVTDADSEPGCPAPSQRVKTGAGQAGAGKRRVGHRQGGGRRRAAVVASGVSAGVAVVILARLASAPYRADHSYRAALVDNAGAESLQKSDPVTADQRLRRARREIDDAMALNPWEPSYVEFIASASFKAARALPDGSSQQMATLDDSRLWYRRAVGLAPRDPFLLERYADVLLGIHHFDPSNHAALDAAIEALGRATRANPYSARIEDKRLRALST